MLVESKFSPPFSMSASSPTAAPDRRVLFCSCVVGVASIIFFASSSLRFALFRAGVDLGLFDQILYLASQGLPTASSISIDRVTLIGDHAAFMLYPMSWLYRIYPDPHWMLAVQALALTGGAIPVYALCVQQKLPPPYARALSLCYLLYPALFTINFYTEFRVETLAVPMFLWAIWAARAGKLWQVALALFVAMGCKETVSFTIIGFGVWIWLFEKRRNFGLAAIAIAVVWFAIASQVIIPASRPAGVLAGVWNYGSLGGSWSEIAVRLISNPTLGLSRVVQPDRLFYYLLLLLPVILGLHWRAIGIMVPALPMLALNILADYAGQRDLIHHYSLLIIPFLITWLIDSLALYFKRGKRLWLLPKWLVVWSIISFLALAKYTYFFTRFLPLLPENGSVRTAVSLVEPDSSVLAASFLVPHLSQRQDIYFASDSWTLDRIRSEAIEEVLIGYRYLEHNMSPERAAQLVAALQQARDFDLVFDRDEIFLFRSKSVPMTNDQ